MLRLSSLVFTLSLFATIHAQAVPENQVAEWKKQVLDNRDGFFTHDSFSGILGKKISYFKFGQNPGGKGCIVISIGLGEAALKYIEVAYDLAQKGFSPIYVIDQRGQGFSQRLLADPQKIYVDKFEYYAKDFQLLVDNIAAADPACHGHDMFLLAHSMGGAIAVNYLENVGSHNPFRKVALNSPMLKIAYPKGKTEDSVIRETWLACHTPFGPRCDDYAPGRGPYNPNSPFEGNPATHSAARFEINRDVYARWTQAQLGGPTVHWISEAANANKRERNPKLVAQITLPLLVLQASEDSYVDNSAQNEVCSLVRGCRLEKIEGAKHEILMESDSLRDQGIGKIVDFFGTP